MSDSQYLTTPTAEKGNLQLIQDGLATLLQADNFFLDIPVFTEKIADLENEITRAISVVTQAGGKCGAAVLVITPQCRSSRPNLLGPYFDRVAIIIRIIEHVQLNQADTGTKKVASLIAEKVAAALHRQSIGTKSILISDIKLVPPESPETVIYDVIGETSFGITPKQLAPVQAVA